MTTLDTAVIVVFLSIVTGIGLWAGRRRTADSVAGFFLGDRKAPWWLLGTSMVATTFAADTPLTVAGISIRDGVAGNWFWWSLLLSHAFVAVVLARLWRRSGVVTDAELCALRYTGRSAVALRRIKGFLFAVPVNCIIMGWVFRAMTKVAAEVLPGVPVLAVLGTLFGLAFLYSIWSGYRGVVFTDLVQFPVALAGAVALAWLAVDRVGGLEAVAAGATAARGPGAVSLWPMDNGLLPWHAFVAFLGIQWWAQKNADGGGIFVQRLLSARSESDARAGGLWFCVAHYILRPWPWILTGLAAVTLVPDVVARDPEAAYGALVGELLPSGLRGLVVASFLAAFMSTIDTHLNWGAAYVVNDLAPWLRDAPERVRARATRGAVALMGGLAIAAALAIDSIAGAWEIVIAFGAGAGAPVLLRWFWWRITAPAEIAAMVASVALSVGVYVLVPEWPYSAKLGVVAFGSTLVWLPVALATTPSPAALVGFYETVRPPGPGWRRVARAAGFGRPAAVWPSLLAWAAVVASLLGVMLALGTWLLGA